MLAGLELGTGAEPLRRRARGRRTRASGRLTDKRRIARPALPRRWGGVDERTRLDPSGWAGVERIALSTAGVLTAAFGLAVLIGGASLGARAARRPRGVAQRHPRARAVAAGRRHRARRARRDARRRSAPGRATCASAPRARRSCCARRRSPRSSPPASRSPTASSERDQRHERLLAIAENDMRHATVGAVDRLTDVASTVQGPLSVRRSQFDALAARLLTEPALTSVALARRAGGRAPARSGADDAPGRPARYKIVFATSRGKNTPSREAVELSAGRAAVEGAIRSGETRATQVLPAVDGSPPSIAVAVPVQPSARRRVGRVPHHLLRRGGPHRRGRAPAQGDAASRSRRAREPAGDLDGAKIAPRQARRPRVDARARAARRAPGPRARHAARRRPAHGADRRRRLAGAAPRARRARADRDPPRRARPAPSWPAARPRSARRCSPRPPPT